MSLLERWKSKLVIFFMQIPSLNHRKSHRSVTSVPGVSSTSRSVTGWPSATRVSTSSVLNAVSNLFTLAFAGTSDFIIIKNIINSKISLTKNASIDFCRKIPTKNLKIYYGQVFCEECFNQHVLSRNRDNPSEFFRNCFEQWQNNAQFAENMRDFMTGNKESVPFVFMMQGQQPPFCRCGTGPQDWFQQNEPKKCNFSLSSNKILIVFTSKRRW